MHVMHTIKYIDLVIFVEDKEKETDDGALLVPAGPKSSSTVGD